MRSCRVDIPIKHVAIHKKVRVRPQAGRSSSTHRHHIVQSIIIASLGIRLGALDMSQGKYSIYMLYYIPKQGGRVMEQKRMGQIEKKIAQYQESTMGDRPHASGVSHRTI